MDITRFVVSAREAAFLYGDHATYRSQLAKKLVNCRKKLNIATKNRGKYQKKPAVTAEQIGERIEYLHLQLLTAERAWAHAMAMKTAHAALATASDTKGGLHGRSRKHVLSRLDKAARTAEALVPLVAQTAVTGATDTDVLEVRAYAAMLRGAVDFERGAWQPCLTSYAVAHVLYNALASADLKKAAAAAAGKKSDAGRSTGSIDNERTPLYKDLLSETIDPSIRYAAYQLKMPRTLSVPAIARRAFPSSADAGSLTETVDRLDPTILNPAAAAATAAGGDTGGPKTLTWRSREVRIEDARISAAWGALATARQRLAERLSSSSAAGPLLPRDMAAAYDEVLTVSQDAVDATKQAMDDLRGEGVAASDPRMQSLQVTRTAVNYEMISWRIGRNRVLTGAKDGITMDSAPSSRRHAKKAAKDGKARDERNLAPSRQIARLREKVALYDSTLQSIESVKELPGIAADEELSQTLEGTYGYFYALKCLSIARSHSIAGNQLNALALTKQAFDKSELVTRAIKATKSDGSPTNIQVYRSDVENLHDTLRRELERYRALVDLEKLQKKATADGSADSKAPLIDHLQEYPVGGVDLNNIVIYPPKFEPVPAKPIFLDVAWNYIEYPDRMAKEEPKKGAAAEKTEPAAPAQPQRKGWFSFGR